MQTISTHRLKALMSTVCNKVLILLTVFFFLDLVFNEIYITCTVPRREGWLIFCSGPYNFISQIDQNNFVLYLSKQLSVKECPDDYRMMTDFISLLTDESW